MCDGEGAMGLRGARYPLKCSDYATSLNCTSGLFRMRTTQQDLVLDKLHSG